MPRQKKQPTDETTKPLETIWEVPDDLWMLIEPVLTKHDPPARTGRKRADARACLDAILYRLRTGCQWNHLPTTFPDDSTVHRTFQRWVQRGIFHQIWADLIQHCQELGAVDWEWQAADTALSKARSGGIRLAQTRLTGEKLEPNGAS